jgi:hypothetical protein
LKVSSVFDNQPPDHWHQQQQQQQGYASTPIALRETMPIAGKGKKSQRHLLASQQSCSPIQIKVHLQCL